MLQQTQTTRVLKHFSPFVERFSDVWALAIANRGEVLSLWSGLGYNRRADALHRTAALISDRFGGLVPRSEQELRSLPGVGPATAGAIRAFGYGLPAVFIETNIRRAVLHEMFPDRKGVSDRELLLVLEHALDRTDPRTWYWALMDYGAELARTVPNPNRRSSHYTQQTRFEGSNRQQRGLILRVLANRGTVPVDQLWILIGAFEIVDRDRAKHNLEAMVAEGFLDTEGGSVTLASGRENA